MGLKDKLRNIGRNLPIVGDLASDEKVDQNTIDTGLGYYDQPRANSQQLYDQALARSQASYQAGNIRDINLSGADRLVGQQTANLGTLGDAAAGRGPSAAQAQYSAALAQGQNAALGLAASSRGAGRGAARLQALSQFGNQAGVQAQKAAALRAQEQQSAMQAYTAALQGARGQDIGLATDRAQLTLNRDVASDNAGRAAFQATQNAQQGWVNAAGSANNTQANVAQDQARSKQAQYDLARAEEERRRRGHAANRQALTSTGGKIAEMV